MTLAAGARCTVAILFFPSYGLAGSVTGGIVFNTSGAVSPQVFDIKGMMLQPFTFSPTSLTFGPQAVAQPAHRKP